MEKAAIQITAAKEPHEVHSAFGERIVERVFIGEASPALWQQNFTDVEVLRPEFDASVSELVIGYRAIVPHIQLKVSVVGREGASVIANCKLMQKPSGCILWIVVADDLEARAFHWFGNGREIRCRISLN